MKLNSKNIQKEISLMANNNYQKTNQEQILGEELLKKKKTEKEQMENERYLQYRTRITKATKNK